MNHEQARAAIFRGETVRARFVDEKHVFDYKLVDGKIFWKVHTFYNGGAAPSWGEWTDSQGDFYSGSTRAAKFTRVVKKVKPAPAPTYPRWVKHKSLDTFYIFRDAGASDVDYVHTWQGVALRARGAFTGTIENMFAHGHKEVSQSEVEAAVGRVTLANLLKGMA